MSRGNGNGNGTNPPTTGPTMGPGTIGGIPVYTTTTSIIGSSFSYNKPVKIPIIPLSPAGGYNVMGGKLSGIASLMYQKWQQNNTTCTTSTGPGGPSANTNGTGINANKTYGQSVGASGTNLSFSACFTYLKNTNSYSMRLAAQASFTRAFGQNNWSIFFAGYINF